MNIEVNGKGWYVFPITKYSYGGFRNGYGVKSDSSLEGLFTLWASECSSYRKEKTSKRFVRI